MPRAAIPTRDETSAGGIVLRPGAGDGLEVVLIATHGGERWALPKGLINAGESPEVAAVREVREETGLTAAILAPLEAIDYWFWWGNTGHKVRHHKRVYFYLMRCLGGDTANHDREVDEARWWPLAEASERASYGSERKLLAGALARQAEVLAALASPPDSSQEGG